MNATFSIPGNFRAGLLSAGFDFGASPDTFKVLLMRDGFTFNSQTHLKKINVKASTGAIDYSISLATKTITRVTAAPHDHGTLSFITDGFVAGNQITTDGTANGVYVIRSVTATTMRIDHVSGTEIADETATAKTISCVDEHAAGGGYTQDSVTATFTLSGSVLVLDSFDWSDFGTAIATSQGAIIYDDTQANDPIVCYVRFSDWVVNF